MLKDLAACQRVISAAPYAKIAGVFLATATRDLAELEAVGAVFRGTEGGRLNSQVGSEKANSHNPAALASLTRNLSLRRWYRRINCLRNVGFLLTTLTAKPKYLAR